MNKLESCSINGPYDSTEECARFAIDEAPGRYVITGVTKVGNAYVLSFWARAEDVGVIYAGGTTIEVTASWKKHTIAITASQTDVSLVFGQTGTYYLCRTKLEEGNKPTDWSPAPGDFSTTQQMRSEIKLQIDSITLSVEDSLNGSAVIKLATGEDAVQEEHLPDARKMFANSNSSAEISAGKVTFNAGTLVINSENLQLDTDGNVSITGKITATSGRIGNCEINEKGTLIVPAANITGTLTVENEDGGTLFSAGDCAVQLAGWKATDHALYTGDSFEAAQCFLSTGSEEKFSIGGSEALSGWVLKAGGNFGVTKEGKLYAGGASISGTITATSGRIGNCAIDEEGNLVVPTACIDGELSAEKIDVKSLRIDAAQIVSGTLNAQRIDGSKLRVSSGATIATWYVDNESLYYTEGEWGEGIFVCTGSTRSCSIGGSEEIDGWAFGAGGNFGVTLNGDCYLSSVHISGGSMRMKIPFMDNAALAKSWYLDGQYAIIDTNGIGMSTVNRNTGSGSSVRITTNGVVFESGVSYSTTPLMLFRDTGEEDDDGEAIIDKTLIGTWNVGALGSAVQVTSDRTAKYEIQSQPEVYSQLFDKLRPVTYKYKNGTSGRTHTGFIAQEVEEAVLSLGLSTQDFAAVCYEKGKNGSNFRYGIRYEEIVSMNTYELQKLKQRVAELEKKLTEQEALWKTTEI